MLDSSKADLQKLETLLLSNDLSNVELAFTIGQNYAPFKETLQELAIIWKAVDWEQEQELSPQQVMYMTRWNRLSMRSYQLQQLPRVVGLLHNLTQLDVSNNQLAFWYYFSVFDY